MWHDKRQPRIKKTCDFCNESAFGLMRRHSEGKTFCSPHCEASFTNCRMIERPDAAAGRPNNEFIVALRYP